MRNVRPKRASKVGRFPHSFEPIVVPFYLTAASAPVITVPVVISVQFIRVELDFVVQACAHDCVCQLIANMIIVKFSVEGIVPPEEVFLELEAKARLDDSELEIVWPIRVISIAITVVWVDEDASMALRVDSEAVTILCQLDSHSESVFCVVRCNIVHQEGIIGLD